MLIRTTRLHHNQTIKTRHPVYIAPCVSFCIEPIEFDWKRIALHGGQPPQAPTFQPPHYGAPAYQPAGPGVPISSPRLPTCSLRFPTSPHSGVFPSHSGVFTSHSGVFTPIVVVSAPVAGPPYPDTELAPDIKLPAAICSATLSGFIASGTSLWCTCSGASDVFTGPSHKYT